MNALISVICYRRLLHTFLVVETKKEVAAEELKVVYINPHSYFSGKTPKGDPQTFN